MNEPTPQEAMMNLSVAELNSIALKKKNARLTARVMARNAANAEANRLKPILREIYRPYLGKKVETQSGAIAKLKAAYEPLLANTHALRVNRYSDNYCIMFRVQATAGFEGEWRNEDATVYIGGLERGFDLKELYDDVRVPDLRTDYTVEGVLAAREAYKVAKRKMEEARNETDPFGENDW